MVLLVLVLVMRMMAKVRFILGHDGPSTHAHTPQQITTTAAATQEEEEGRGKAGVVDLLQTNKQAGRLIGRSAVGCQKKTKSIGCVDWGHGRARVQPTADLAMSMQGSGSKNCFSDAWNGGNFLKRPKSKDSYEGKEY